MTTGKIIQEDLKAAKIRADNALIEISKCQTNINRLLKALEAEDTFRNLAFAYDIEDYGEEAGNNKVVKKVLEFEAKNRPTEFEPSSVSMRSLFALAEILDHGSVMRPSISCQALGPVLSFAFKLGYAKGWEKRRSGAKGRGSTTPPQGWNIEESPQKK